MNNLKASSYSTKSTEIADYICQLPFSISPEYVSINLIPQLREANTLQEIIELISPFIKFNQYELLKLLVEKFGEENAKRELQEYTSSVEEFNRLTTVRQLVELLVEQQEHWTQEDRERLRKADEDGSTIKMILNSSYSEKTLEQLYYDVWCLFECEEYVLAVADARPDSIELLWYTSSSVISSLSKNARKNEDKMDEMRITTLMVGHDPIKGQVSNINYSTYLLYIVSS